jgi:hypothetical protein
MADKQNTKYFREQTSENLVHILFALKGDRQLYSGQLIKAGRSNQDIMSKKPVWRHVQKNHRDIAKVLTILRERGIKVEEGQNMQDIISMIPQGVK